MEITVKGRTGPCTFFFDEPVNLKECFTRKGSTATCICGCEIKNIEENLYSHLTTDKHRRYLDMKNNGINPLDRRQTAKLVYNRKQGYNQQLCSNR